jgi:hypothetical protein
MLKISCNAEWPEYYSKKIILASAPRLFNTIIQLKNAVVTIILQSINTDVTTLGYANCVMVIFPYTP